jgi:hypothetical protein
MTAFDVFYLADLDITIKVDVSDYVVKREPFHVPIAGSPSLD